MCKKNLLFYAAFLLSTPLMAQPVLNANNNAPQLGDQITQQGIYGYSGTEGAAGPNQTWDFSQADTNNMTAITPQYVDCSQAPHCTENTGTTIVFEASTNIYNYLAVDNSGISITGSDGIFTSQGMGNLFLHYTDPEQMMYYPMNYGDTHTDSWYATADDTYIGGSQITDISERGTTTVTADAYGTLQLPGATYQDVLRVYTHRVYNDSMVDQMAVSIPVDMQTYSWYKAGMSIPLLTITYVNANNHQMPAILNYAKDYTASVKDVTQAELSGIYPNPASGILNIQLKNSADGLQTVRIINLLGQAIAAYPSNILKERAKGVYSLNVENIPSGMYILQVQTKNGLDNQKIEILK